MWETPERYQAVSRRRIVATMGAADNPPKSKTIHEAFARFFEKPSREALRVLLREHMGELRECDFKEAWPGNGAIARHVLGLANAGGGCLIVGVRQEDDQTLKPVGVTAMKDKADVVSAIKPYAPQVLLDGLQCGDFAFDASEYPLLVGKRFQVVFVLGRPDAVPFVAQRDGDGIRGGAIYIRREGSTNEASHEEVQQLIERRIAASPQTPRARDLKSHLEELKVLYAEIPRHISGVPPIFQGLIDSNIEKILGTLVGDPKDNPHYPKEDYEQFIVRVLESKKKAIEDLLGIRA